jgi:molybdate transport system substrate-binding protein
MHYKNLMKKMMMHFFSSLKWRSGYKQEHYLEHQAVKVRSTLPYHPCMHEDAHDHIARLHLPVALHCNIHCRFCERIISPLKGHLACPGTTADILSPQEALTTTKKFLEKWGDQAIVGVAGPGEPLANPETFETLELIRKEFPRSPLCLCTNGLNLPDSIEALIKLNITHLSVTINGVHPKVVAALQPWVIKNGKTIIGEEGAKLLIKNQFEGIKAAVSSDLFIKINVVVVPGINDSQVETIARVAGRLGAGLLNLIPLIPRGSFTKMVKPSPCYLKELKEKCKPIIPVFEKCKQCRADAEGIPGKEVKDMSKDKSCVNRRQFIKAAGVALTSSVLTPQLSCGSTFKGEQLQVWSCGGLAEAMVPASKLYEQMTGCTIAYTGAFAAALGKSLLGSAKTEVFAPRVLALAKKLKAEGKMAYFKPLCFTKYVLITPKGNPAGIQKIEDLAKPGVRVILSPHASPPGGDAVMTILKKAGVLEGAKKNAVVMGDCVQRIVPDVISGKGDVSLVELRLTRMPQCAGKIDSIEIPEKFIPPTPIPFVIGVMKWAKNRDLAGEYLNFILSEKGQSFFDAAGFIPALSEEGERLIKKYGVKDA